MDQNRVRRPELLAAKDRTPQHEHEHERISSTKPTKGQPSLPSERRTAPNMRFPLTLNTRSFAAGRDHRLLLACGGVYKRPKT